MLTSKTKLVCLPERIPYQRHLRYLNLRGTDLLQLPENLAILDKLEQLTIGSSVLHEIPVTVANLRGLTELFLIQCSGLRRILPEGIAAPNIKILAIDGCSIDNFSFQDQGILDAQNIHRIQGLNRQERLNCVHISTDNRVIWNDLCVLLRSPAHQKPSTAIFSGGADNYKKFNKGDMLRIAQKFDQILDICFYSGSDGSTFARELLDNFHSHTVILMFFITDNVKSRFRVTFTPGIGGSQSLTLEYSSFTRSRDGRGVHVFMWREEDEEGCIVKRWRPKSSRNVKKARLTEIGGLVSRKVEEERGWILMVDNETDVSEICGEFIRALT